VSAHALRHPELPEATRGGARAEPVPGPPDRDSYFWNWTRQVPNCVNEATT